MAITKHKLIGLLQDFDFVTVVFVSQNGSHSAHYKYKIKPGLSFAVGDRVVVPVSADDCYKVATVLNVQRDPVIDPECTIDYRWIVSKVDDSEYLSQLKNEEEAAELLIQIERARLKKDLLADVKKALGRNTPESKLFARAMKLANGGSDGRDSST